MIMMLEYLLCFYTKTVRPILMKCGTLKPRLKIGFLGRITEAKARETAKLIINLNVKLFTVT